MSSLFSHLCILLEQIAPAPTSNNVMRTYHEYHNTGSKQQGSMDQVQQAQCSRAKSRTQQGACVCIRQQAHACARAQHRYLEDLAGLEGATYRP